MIEYTIPETILWLLNIACNSDILIEFVTFSSSVDGEEMKGKVYVIAILMKSKYGGGLLRLIFYTLHMGIARGEEALHRGIVMGS